MLWCYFEIVCRYFVIICRYVFIICWFFTIIYWYFVIMILCHAETLLLYDDTLVLYDDTVLLYDDTLLSSYIDNLAYWCFSILIIYNYSYWWLYIFMISLLVIIGWEGCKCLWGREKGKVIKYWTLRKIKKGKSLIKWQN